MKLSPEETPPDFAAMDDETLSAAMAKLHQDRAILKEKLERDISEGGVRGHKWRNRAGRERAVKRAWLDIAEHIIRERRKTQGFEQRRETRLRRAEMFLAAARRILSAEQMEQLWQAARERFPDAPELQED